MTATRTRADDIQAITKQIYNYCRSMDRMDKEIGYAVWHEDGLADYGETIFQGTGRGFIDFVTDTHARMISHSHQVANIIINLDGDRAGSESYVTGALRFDIDGQLTQVIVRGRYCDRWSCRNGRWAIDKRVFVHDFDERRTIDAIQFPGWSTRDKNDPSYAILALED